jgi:hypothetical protein
MRLAAKRDANESTLVEVARKCGFQIEYFGPLDLWAGLKGIFKPVEIKNRAGRNRFTRAQRGFKDRCLLSGLPFVVWRTVDDVVNAANTWGIPETRGDTPRGD